MKQDRRRLLSVLLTILLCSLARILPHPPNFTPVIAAAVLGGVFVKDLKTAILFPLAIMFLSDLFLGLHGLIPVTYSALALCSYFSWKTHRNSKIRMLALGCISAAFFFLVSNLGVWAFSGMYSLNALGLSACFAAALPFFPATLNSTLLYLGAATLVLSLDARQLKKSRAAGKRYGAFG